MINIFGYHKDNDEEELFAFELKYIPRVGETIRLRSKDTAYKVTEVIHMLEDDTSLIKGFIHTVTIVFEDYAD